LLCQSPQNRQQCVTAVVGGDHNRNKLRCIHFELDYKTDKR
jgi:hypothetical protein